MASLARASSTNAYVVWSRYVLAVLAGLFAVGAVVQVFLAGLAVFEGAPFGFGRWDDHANFGHMLGTITFILWIPALLGRVGLRLIVAAILMFVLMALQYIFVAADEPSVQALHPVNAVVMFAISAWIAWRTVRLLRRSPAAEVEPAGMP